MKPHNTYRQNVTLPARMAQRAHALAKNQRAELNRLREGRPGSGFKPKERDDQRPSGKA